MSQDPEYSSLLARAFAATDDGIVVIDGAGRPRFVNEAARMLLGPACPDDRSPLALAAVFRGGDSAALPVLSREEPLARALRGEAVTAFPIQRVDAAGREVHLEVTAGPIVEQGGVAGAVAVFRDVTTRSAQERQLQRATRLRAMREVADQLGHDLGNLLGPLAGFPELIKATLPPEHPAVEFCDLLVQVAHDLIEINDGLLALARSRQTARAVLDLNRLVEDTLAQIPAPRAVMLDLAADLRPVVAAEGSVGQLIASLLANAREATADRGTIYLKTENVRADSPFGPDGRLPPGSYVALEIGDDGPGIPAELQDRVFEPFFTTRRPRRRHALGLGLTIVQAIVEDHGGAVEVRSEPGKGAIVRVYFLPSPN